MTTFDGWETRLYGDAMALPAGQLSDNELMHYRTKGSRNGHRRYQNPDGSWTPLGLKERKEREGWGERREQRREARAARKEARQAAKSARKAAVVEKLKKNDLSNLSDAELKKKIERVKMEQEYKELTKSPALKLGEKLVSNYLSNRALKAERAYKNAQDKIQFNRDMEKLKEQTKQKELESKANEEKAKADLARANADKARAETDKIDIEKGTRAMKLKNEKKNLKLQGKRYFSDNTILGGVKKMANKILSGKGEAAADIITGSAENAMTYRTGKTEARTARKQAKMLNRYNVKNGGPFTPAQIPQGGYTYWQRRQKNNGGGKGKGKGNNNNNGTT